MKLPATPEQLYKRVNDFYRPLLEASTTRFPHSAPQASSFHLDSSDPPILIEAVALNVTRFGAAPSSQKRTAFIRSVRQQVTTRPPADQPTPSPGENERSLCCRIRTSA